MRISQSFWAGRPMRRPWRNLPPSGATDYLGTGGLQLRGGLDDRPHGAPTAAAIKTCSASGSDLFGGRGPAGDRLRHGLAGHPFAQAYVHQRTPKLWVTDHRIARMEVSLT